MVVEPSVTLVRANPAISGAATVAVVAERLEAIWKSIPGQPAVKVRLGDYIAPAMIGPIIVNVINRQEKRLRLTTAGAFPAVVIEDHLTPLYQIFGAAFFRLPLPFFRPHSRWIGRIALFCPFQPIWLIFQIMSIHTAFVTIAAFIPATALLAIVEVKINEKLFSVALFAAAKFGHVIEESRRATIVNGLVADCPEGQDVPAVHTVY